MQEKSTKISSKLRVCDFREKKMKRTSIIIIL